jgi:hypothetical protein
MGLQKPDDFSCFSCDKQPKYVTGNIALDYGTVMHAVLPYMYSGDVVKPCEMFDKFWAMFPYGESDKKRNTVLTKS